MPIRSFIVFFMMLSVIIPTVFRSTSVYAETNGRLEQITQKGLIKIGDRTYEIKQKKDPEKHREAIQRQLMGMDVEPTKPTIVPATTEITVATIELTPTPTITPGSNLVTIRRAVIQDGAIVQVEIQVTATPGGANTEPEPTQTPKPLDSFEDEIRQKLTSAIDEASGPVHFPPRMIAKLRENFMTLKNKDPEMGGKLSRDRILQVQNALQRLSAMAMGGVIDSSTARDLITALWSDTSKSNKPAEIRISNSPASTGPEEKDEDKESTTEAVPTPQAEPETYEYEEQIYYDPNTGLYIYEDGTPLDPQPDYGYDEYYGTGNSY